MASANRRRPSDMFWYVGVGLLMILAILAVAVWVPETKIPNRKWVEFAFYSLMLFVFLSKMYWRYRSRTKLWLAMLATSAVHVSAYVPVLRQTDNSPALWYVVLMPIEGMVIMLLIWWLLHVPPDTKTSL